jgi:hypothetical protein
MSQRSAASGPGCAAALPRPASWDTLAVMSSTEVLSSPRDSFHLIPHAAG